MTRIIDVFNHYLPPEFSRQVNKLGGNAHMMNRARGIRAMADLDFRLALMDRYPGYCQIPTIVSPSVEQLVPAENTAPLARCANEAFALMCQRYPRQFPSFAAALPLDDMDKAIREAEYAVRELGAAGVQIFTNHNGGPIDTPDFYCLYEKLAEMNAALWIHPARTVKEPYYISEEYERYELWYLMMWPVETTMAVSRLVYSGLFKRFPDLPVVIHHAGGMVPMLSGRLENGLKMYGTRTAPTLSRLTETPVKGTEQAHGFRQFYADCATCGSQPAIECALAFYGAERMMFATDMPFDPEGGSGYIERTLRDVTNLPVASDVKELILHGNAERVFRLKP